MPGATRVNADLAGGVILTGSNNVFYNGSPAARKGSRIAGHGRTPHSSPIMIQGSPNVFVNGIEACKQGDAASCGHRATGSPNVFIN